MHTTEQRAADLYEKANAAAADAIRYRRDPNGHAMAATRERDAYALRAMARAALET